LNNIPPGLPSAYFSMKRPKSPRWPNAYDEEEGRAENLSLEHWSRAEREIRARHTLSTAENSGPPPTGLDIRMEELMHLDA